MQGLIVVSPYIQNSSYNIFVSCYQHLVQNNASFLNEWMNARYLEEDERSTKISLPSSEVVLKGSCKLENLLHISHSYKKKIQKKLGVLGVCEEKETDWF